MAWALHHDEASVASNVMRSLMGMRGARLSTGVGDVNWRITTRKRTVSTLVDPNANRRAVHVFADHSALVVEHAAPGHADGTVFPFPLVAKAGASRHDLPGELTWLDGLAMRPDLRIASTRHDLANGHTGVFWNPVLATPTPLVDKAIHDTLHALMVAHILPFLCGGVDLDKTPPETTLRMEMTAGIVQPSAVVPPRISFPGSLVDRLAGTRAMTTLQEWCAVIVRMLTTNTFPSLPAGYLFGGTTQHPHQQATLARMTWTRQDLFPSSHTRLAAAALLRGVDVPLIDF